MSQRNIEYTDGTPSREVEDWEASGGEEMNELHDKIKRRTTTKVRDRLNNARALVVICTEALRDSKYIDIKSVVTNVLHFYVEDQLRIAEEELKKI